MKKAKRLQRAFGYNEHGYIDIPKKISGTQISRIQIGDDMGCSWCFPHGYETINCTVPERNWKSQRKTQWKQKS